MLQLNYTKHTSIFKTPGGTSRGVLHTKDSWILQVFEQHKPEIRGLGEVSIIEKLSIDNPQQMEEQLVCLQQNINLPYNDLIKQFHAFPAIQFGLECALLDLKNGGKQLWFESDFTKGIKAIPMNGLVWMGTYEQMRGQLLNKLEEGFTCIKLKVGAIDFEQELSLLKQIRKEFSAQEIELRVDANGAFLPSNAEEKLKRLAEYELHSIEQPIKQGQLEEMAKLCASNILPIALDEELIGVPSDAQKISVLDVIKPQYIIIKPSLIGGFKASESWIALAKQRQIAWWATSALETNIGLNAIAQWTATTHNTMPQGLGTGQLFTNNFEAPLVVKSGALHYQISK